MHFFSPFCLASLAGERAPQSECKLFVAFIKRETRKTTKYKYISAFLGPRRAAARRFDVLYLTEKKEKEKKKSNGNPNGWSSCAQTAYMQSTFTSFHFKSSSRHLFPSLTSYHHSLHERKFAFLFTSSFIFMLSLFHSIFGSKSENRFNFLGGPNAKDFFLFSIKPRSETYGRRCKATKLFRFRTF